MKNPISFLCLLLILSACIPEVTSKIPSPSTELPPSITPSSTHTLVPTATETPIPTSTFTPEPTASPTPDLSLAPIIEESLTCANANWCFMMTVDNEKGKEFYLLFLDALAMSHANRSFWRELGLTDLSGKGLLKFLKSSVGPDGSNYYLPLQTQNGTRLQLVMPKTIQGSNHFVTFQPIPGEVEDGIILDGLRVLVIAPATWSSNYFGIHDFVAGLPLLLSKSLLNYNSIWGDRNEVGLNITSDQRFLLILGAREKPTNPRGGSNESFNTMGNSKDDIFRSADLKIGTALALTYIHAMRDFQTINRNQNLYYKDQISYMCVSRRQDCNGVLVFDLDENDMIFTAK